MSFEVLLDAVSQRLSNRIPPEVAKLIQMFYSKYGSNWDVFLFCPHGQNLYNITSQKYHNHLASNLDKSENLYSPQYPIHPNYIINNCKLPKYITKRLKVDLNKNNQSNSQQLLTSSHWSFVWQFEKEKSMVTLFHASQLSSTKAKTSFRYQPQPTCNIYQYLFPSFPSDHDTFLPSVTYSQQHQTLFTVHTPPYYSPFVYELYLNRGDLKPKWRKSMRLSVNVYGKYARSLCMVDSDRFMAILSGSVIENENENENESIISTELYALNCNKSIKLSNLNGLHNARNINSLYNDRLHKIIACGEDRWIEVFDINKDKWIEIRTDEENTRSKIRQIWICQDNPYIIHRSYNNNRFQIETIDLRDEWTIKKVESFRRDKFVLKL